MKLTIATTLTLALAGALVLTAFAPGAWVEFGPDHKLRYRTDERGNRIMDFSYAGYAAGGVRIPTVAAAKSLTPVAGDNTAQIQAAIDEVSTRPLDAAGFRGAVALGAGTYDVQGAVTISASGVVLRGAGAADGGTNIRLTGAPHRFLEIRGAGTWKPLGPATAITDPYVPSGALTFHVADAAQFHAGDAVLVERPVTEAWVHFMGMDTLVRDGKAQTWIKVGASIRTDRLIHSVTGNLITLDAPLSDSLDSKYVNAPGAPLGRYTFPGRISHVGLEDLRVSAPVIDVPITDGQFTALRLDAAIDSWVRNIDIVETQNGITIGAAAKQVTFQHVRIMHSAPHSGAAAPADFSVSGTQILLDKCSVDGEGTWPVVTQANVTGPNVVLNFSGAAHAGVSPHQRWATGLLVDGLTMPNTVQRTPAVAFSNRKTAGSGHGWDVGWAVAWNVKSPFLLVQQPPGAMNWCIGCSGESIKQQGITEGVFESTGHAVEPASLYLEQLRERLGETAVKNIGY